MFHYVVFFQIIFFRCLGCQKEFVELKDLLDHNTLVICSVCNIHFDTASETDQHRKTHHTCRTCQHECRNRHDLLFHQNNQHGGEELQAWPADNMWNNDQELREIME